MKHLLVILLSFVFSAVSAETLSSDSAHHIGFAIDVNPSIHVGLGKWMKNMQKHHKAFSAKTELNWVVLPGDSSAYDSDFNYPTLSVGFRFNWNDVTLNKHEAEGISDSKLGNLATTYFSFTRPFIRNRHWMFDYTLGTGVTYSHLKYNKNTNLDNELTGSRWLLYFTAGLHATCRFAKDWGIRAGIDYYHSSNGALNRPNKGINFIGPMLGVVYIPYYQILENRQKNRYRQPFKPYLFTNITLGVGGKVLNEDWLYTQYRLSPDSAYYRTGRLRFYTAYSAQADVMYRYTRRWASGIGVDLFYGNYSNRLKTIDELYDYENQKHNPWSVGLAFKHQVYYHNLSLSMSFGWYLYHHLGQQAQYEDKPYYERIGLHYSFPSMGGLSVGANIAAHKTKADFTEIVISLPIRLTR